MINTRNRIKERKFGVHRMSFYWNSHDILLGFAPLGATTCATMLISVVHCSFKLIAQWTIAYYMKAYWGNNKHIFRMDAAEFQRRILFLHKLSEKKNGRMCLNSCKSHRRKKEERTGREELTKNCVIWDRYKKKKIEIVLQIWDCLFLFVNFIRIQHIQWV